MRKLADYTDSSLTGSLSDIQNQYQKLKYPVGYFQEAFLIEYHWHHFGKGDHLHSPDTELYFDVVSMSSQRVTGSDEVRPIPNEIIEQTFANCYELPLGILKIYLTASSEEMKKVFFDAWPEGKKDEVEPQVVSFEVKRGNSNWEIGKVYAERGTDKETPQVKVEIYDQPVPSLGI